MTNRILTLLLILLPLACFAKEQRPIEKDIEWANTFVDTNPDSALIAVDIIKDRYGRRLTDADRIRLYIISGNAWFSNGEVGNGVSDLRKAVAQARSARDTTLLIEALSDLGVMSRVAQKTDSALLCYQEALQLMNRHRASAEDKAHLLTSIAILYTNTKRISDAVPFARKAVKEAEASGVLETIMYAGSQGGMILFLAGYKDEGLEIERRMVSVAEERGAPRYVLKTYASIIDMHHKMGNRDSVMVYIERGNRLMKLVPDGSVESLGFMEESYVVLTAMGKYSESLAIQKRILSMKDAGTYMPMDKLWLRIARNYEALGDYRQAGESYERSITISDSLRNTEIDKQLSEFQVKYDMMQKQIDISRLETEKARTTVWMIAGCSILALAIICLVIYILIRHRHEAYARITEHLKGVEEERARLARDLHDGICNDIYGVSLMLSSRTSDKEEVSEIIRKIGDEVRSISHELMPPKFKNSTIDELLKSYALLSKGFLKYETDGGDVNVDSNVAYQLYRIVQELIQNVHKHTLAKHALLQADFRSNSIKLALSYQGEHRHGNQSDNGIGLTTIQRRAELIGANIHRTQNGLSNTITIETK